MYPATSEAILAELISFDTTSRDSNIPLIAWVEGFLSHHGVPHFRVDYEDGRKTNLFATIGPDVEGGVVLSGHTDVVPVDGQAWSSDPFRMEERDGLLYGRGTCDMKGFIAVCLAMVPKFKGMALKVPVHFAFSCDEEVGCRGVVPLVHHMRDNLKRPSAVIVGEPTSMRVVNAHKSAVRYATEVTGHESHSALTDRGVNAIMVAAEIVAEINRIREDFIAEGDPTGRFDPPYSTIHVGTIKGGTANNIVPKTCSFGWETRLIPGADRDFAPKRVAALSRKLEGPMKAVAPETGISTTKATDVPGLAPEKDSVAEVLALHCAHANSTHTVSYCTEAGHFQAIGIPTVICGPGSIEQAHKPDEFIAVEQLRKCEAFMSRLAARCC
ncbi:MAG: acetylornithine deacetylase [Proteobacteria bacterium]|nr:acetylornithine deacetylase [Pseudomonadota bacterium]